MRYAIGLDQATLCGYAVLDEAGGRVASGVWNLAPREGQGAGFRFVRFVGLFRKLREDHGLTGQNAIVMYEQSFSGQRGGDGAMHVSGAEINGGLVAHIQYQCEVAGIPYWPIHYATVKKFATGSGSAAKLRMVQAANSQWHLDLPFTVPELGAMTRGKNPKPKLPTFPGGSDNEADALWIAYAGLRTREGFHPGVPSLGGAGR